MSEKRYKCDSCHKTISGCHCREAFWCLGCGEYFNGRSYGYRTSHVCDEKRVKKREDSRHSHDEMGIEQIPTDYRRLKDGFWMMSLEEDDTVDKWGRHREDYD